MPGLGECPGVGGAAGSLRHKREIGVHADVVEMRPERRQPAILRVIGPAPVGGVGERSLEALPAHPVGHADPEIGA